MTKVSEVLLEGSRRGMILEDAPRTAAFDSEQELTAFAKS